MMSKRLDLVEQFSSRPPEIIFEWKDRETEAVGWLVINSLRGGAAGGGTRMRAGITKNEVITLAKTMEVKFTVCGPPIGGAKSGIAFHPNDPRKGEVLARWFKAVAPILRSYHGTSGDLNINEWQDIMPHLEKEGIMHPQAGIVRGHFGVNGFVEERKIKSLQRGLKLPVLNKRYAPQGGASYNISRMVTGYGISEATRLFYEIWGGTLQGKRVIIQGWGNVGAGAGWYLSRLDANIVGITDMEGNVAKPDGFSKAEIDTFFVDKKTAFKDSRYRVDNEEVVWAQEAEIFVPAAASHVVSSAQLSAMKERKLQLIVSGANAPFMEQSFLYGETTRHADNTFSILPDFIANCGMARCFAYLMGEEDACTTEQVFEDITNTMVRSLRAIHNKNKGFTGICSSAYDIALQKLNL